MKVTCYSRSFLKIWSHQIVQHSVLPLVLLKPLLKTTKPKPLPIPNQAISRKNSLNHILKLWKISKFCSPPSETPLWLCQDNMLLYHREKQPPFLIIWVLRSHHVTRNRVKWVVSIQISFFFNKIHFEIWTM